MQIYFSLLVALIGLFMYGYCTNQKLVDIGKIMFACGLLAFLLNWSGPVVSLVHR